MVNFQGNIAAARERWHREGVKGTRWVPLLKSYKKHRCKETVDKVSTCSGSAQRYPSTTTCRPGWSSSRYWLISF
ncbi:hypothetical protein B0T14DRAFT_512448 [Immersiella caudata]|uniref:Uncharacterized protein n=1 Tax=Immersiella caudata TaxID=314043 RepID=A0AA40C7S1_9PEZI|nr:hypothetical protein B0T14DRAFT_512448 [Immersiella caudata]